MPLSRALVPAVLLIAALCGGCATNPVTGKADVVTMTAEQEVAIGRDAHPKVLQKYGRYEDEELQAYVSGIGRRIAAVSHRPDLQYTFTVLDTDDINAFALPGGYVYITRGIMAYLNSEAELVAVLGHEVGHVTARHAVRQQTGAAATGVGALLVGILTGSGDLANVANMAGSALVSGYGRDMELEADDIGAQYLDRLGYDPDAMIDVVRLLKNQEMFEIQLARQEGREPRVYHGVFATHPDNDTRLKEVVAGPTSSTRVTRARTAARRISTASTACRSARAARRAWCAAAASTTPTWRSRWPSPPAGSSRTSRPRSSRSRRRRMRSSTSR